MDSEKIANSINLRELALSTFYYISGSIFGPLILFLGLGYLLDSVFNTKPTMLIIGFFIAFIFSNFLLFKKISKINKKIEFQGKIKGEDDLKE